MFKKSLYSDILDKTYKIAISAKARKCIIKKGSLDNYLLYTDPKKINSNFGFYLRKLIKEKQNNPDFDVPYIPGQSRQGVARKTRSWEYRDVPEIYVPLHVKLNEDQSKYYMKDPSEMSRRELIEF